MTPAQLIEEVTKAGFRHVRTIDDWTRGLFLVLFEKEGKVEPQDPGMP